MTPKLEGGPQILSREAASSGERASATRGRPLIATRRRRRQASPTRIGLFGLFGSGNSGNDGSLEAMLVFLRQVRPEAELTCICHGADQVARDFGVIAIPFGAPEPANPMVRRLERLLFRGPHKLASLVRAIGHSRKLDVLIVPGTGILDDFRERPSGMPLVLFVWCLAAKLCGTKIAFVSIGAGPIEHPISRWLMRSAAKMALYRSYRDRVSEKFMESIGIDTRNDAVYPDIAFKLPTPVSTHPQGTEHRQLTVGVGVMAYHGWRSDNDSGAAIYAAYLGKITDFVLWLLDRGHAVRILMGDMADRPAVADLLASVASARPDLPRNRVLADPMRSLHDLMRQIAETDVVVATRFHNVVCALKLGKPTVSIGYAEKNDVLMAEMGLGDFCQHIEHLNLDRLIEQFGRLLHERESCVQSIRNANLWCQERLHQQDSLLASCVL